MNGNEKVSWLNLSLWFTCLIEINLWYAVDKTEREKNKIIKFSLSLFCFNKKKVFKIRIKRFAFLY